jgi:purine-binding chemotaxis protein CheW
MVESVMEKNAENMEFSTFHVGETLCGINILEIQEINKNFEITAVPQSSNYIKGILNLRGRIITILDLGKKLGLGSVKKNKENTNIIVNAENEHIGLLVDAISDVVSARHQDIEPAPANIGSVKGLYFTGVLKKKNQLIGILNLSEVLKE